MQKQYRVGGRLGVGIVVLLSLVLSACGGTGDETPGEDAADDATTQSTVEAPPADAGANEVAMELIAFKPGKVSVAAGDTVTWIQKDAGFHTVTSGTAEQSGGGVNAMPDGKFESGDIATGDTFEFTFEMDGVYPYFCALHPATMSGEVTVT